MSCGSSLGLPKPWVFLVTLLLHWEICLLWPVKALPWGFENLEGYHALVFAVGFRLIDVFVQDGGCIFILLHGVFDLIEELAAVSCS